MKLFNTFRCLFLSGMVLFLGANSFAQNVTVKGKVSDSSGEPVIGVTVMLSSNNTVGTLTDGNGNYSISVPANASLTFSCVGFATQEESLNGRTVINVVLQEDTEFLDETVVIVTTLPSAVSAPTATLARSSSSTAWLAATWMT